jgi:hypothetical protein
LTRIRAADRAFSAAVNSGANSVAVKTPSDCFSRVPDGLGVGLEDLGVANKVRKALSAAKIKESAFIGRSLALLPPIVVRKQRKTL